MRTLDESLVNDIVLSIAQKHLAALGVEAVDSEPTVDSRGNEALRVTIVIGSESKVAESGDAFLSNLFEIQQTLSAQGEERFPIIEYATREELDSVDDPES